MAFVPTPSNPPVCGAGMVAQAGLCVAGTVSQHLEVWLPCCAEGKPFLYQPGCALWGAPLHSHSLQERRTCSVPATSLPMARKNNPGSGFSCPQPLPST